jgi:hypothetical protein
MPKKYLVKYVGGMALYPQTTDGSLTINETSLEFSSEGLNFKIPTEQIVDIATTETDDIKKAAGSYIALGMAGLAATRSMAKIRLMKVTFKDIMGDLQSPEFRFLPQTVKEVSFYQEVANELNTLRQNGNVKQSSNSSATSSSTIATPQKEATKPTEYQTIQPTTYKKSHTSRNLLIAIVVGVLIVAIAGAGIMATTNPKTTITAMNVHIQYPNPNDSYFGASSQTIAVTNQQSTSLEIAKGQQFYLSFAFGASPLESNSHAITGMRVTTPGFSIVSVNPNTPITLTPGSSTTITITFQSPESYYTGAIDVVFTVT